MSKQRYQERIIGDFMYRFTYMKPEEAFSLFLSLTKAAGPVLETMLRASAISAQAVDQASAEGAFMTAVLNSDVGALLQKLSEGLDEAALQKAMRVFARETTYKDPESGVGGSLDGSAFTEHFKGRFGEQLKWLAYCLEVQFGDFFDSLKTAVTRTSTTPPATA